MGIWELTLIILLSVLLLKPKDIKILTKNISSLIINLNKYIDSIKETIIKAVNIDKK